MALSPTLRKMIADGNARYVAPDTFIPSERYHNLIERLKQITETDDEARDKAIQFALLDVGRIAPESSKSYYE